CASYASTLPFERPIHTCEPLLRVGTVSSDQMRVAHVGRGALAKRWTSSAVRPSRTSTPPSAVASHTWSGVTAIATAGDETAITFPSGLRLPAASSTAVILSIFLFFPSVSLSL
ncbi:hypothetical protein DQ04_08341040, partial [Trypanosoma grayi]|uniref:hypothetical protein n=1 Tax=Trypanosoma grayi TaxID=71804 RepID=UPI0004F4060A